MAGMTRIKEDEKKREVRSQESGEKRKTVLAKDAKEGRD